MKSTNFLVRPLRDSMINFVRKLLHRKSDLARIMPQSVVLKEGKKLLFLLVDSNRFSQLAKDSGIVLQVFLDRANTVIWVFPRNYKAKYKQRNRETSAQCSKGIGNNSYLNRQTLLKFPVPDSMMFINQLTKFAPLSSSNKTKNCF